MVLLPALARRPKVQVLGPELLVVENVAQLPRPPHVPNAGPLVDAKDLDGRRIQVVHVERVHGVATRGLEAVHVVERRGLAELVHALDVAELVVVDSHRHDVAGLVRVIGRLRVGLRLVAPDRLVTTRQLRDLDSWVGPPALEREQHVVDGVDGLEHVLVRQAAVLGRGEIPADDARLDAEQPVEPVSVV